MKTKQIISVAMIVIAGLVEGTKNLSAQAKLSTAVLNVESKGLNLDSSQVSNLVRMELEKTNVFNVIDKYDAADALEKNNLDIGKCFGKECLVQAGKILKADKIITGSAESYGDKIIITLRMIDVKTEAFEQTDIEEYLFLPDAIQTMIGISVRNLLRLPNDEDLAEMLTKKFNYENQINNPDYNKVNLSGPRMGMTIITGEYAKRLQDSEENGGFDMLPFMSSFGWQFETQYLNVGHSQALVEFLFFINGIDQGRFVPALTFLDGYRNNKKGWELGLGPTISIAKKADGYFDNNGKWFLENEWTQTDSLGMTIPNPYRIVSRIDKRGIPTPSTALVLAFGKTFKSGNMNIPVNLFIIPNKQGWRFGFSFGFNAKKK